MGWFTKKDKVPELPRAPQIPELPKDSVINMHELPELPSFQNTNIGEQLNNEVIKSAVQDSSGENEVSVEELPQDFNFPHKSEEGEQSRQTLEISPSSQMVSMSQTKKLEPIFVRVDKFHEAKSDFEEIKKKLKDIETVLKKVKDIKTKEDAEISGWTTELERVKSRISEIDDNFFNKL